ncbi:MAG TPA: ATP-binding protein, partial [Steroidobacteraceae bacterium]
YLRASPAFVRDLMRATRIVDVNNQAVKLFGRGEKGELLTSVAPFWPPESSGTYEAAIIAALTGHPRYSAEMKMSRIDGSLFDALFTIGCPSDATYSGTLMVGILDVTARKQASHSELRYRNLFHHLPIALWQMNTRGLGEMFADLRRQGVEDLGKYIDEYPEWVLHAMESVVVDEVNQSTADLLGVKDSRELLGPLKTRRANPASLRRMLEARYRGASYFQEETKMVTQNGKVVDGLFFVSSPQPLTDIGISLVGFLDLSERVKAQEMLNKVQAEFAHAARISVLGELTASIAHEVNQPLGAIATNGAAGLRWLNRAEPDIAETRDLMARIVADARRAAEVISRIRGLAMRHAPERVALSLDDVVQETLLVLGCEIKARGVSVTADLMHGNTRVVGDRTQLQQVIMNLTVNALQAMSDRENGRRELLIRTVIGERGHACCGVEDSGPGIPAEAIGRLFESFFTTKPSGMGMGLPICRSIVEAHGGHISADNNSARGGARFLLNLPPAPSKE